jgi:hypothetical protein
MPRRLLLIVVAQLAAASLVPAHACATTLAELSTGGVLETSLLSFDGFTYGGYAGGPTADQVDVATVVLPDGTQGLRFEGDFQFTSISEATIGYRVSAKSNEVLLAAMLTGDPMADMNRIIYVTETFSAPHGSISIGARSGFSFPSFLPVSKQFAVAPLSLQISTSIENNFGAGVSVSYFEQTFRASQPSDFNLDGDVDGGDFLAWQRGLGATGVVGRTKGNANGDPVVDANDLAIWRSQFGYQPPAALGNVVSVPEPGGLALALTSTFTLMLGRWRVLRADR